MAPAQPFMHRTFKEIKIHTAKCDQCNKHNSATIYRCEDCSEQCCTPCWNQQGEDGKHLLNNALTVIIPASEAEKRRRTKKQPAKVVKKGKTPITNKKVETRPSGRKRKVVDDDDVDDTGDEVAAANKTTRVNKKQMKSGLQVPDLYEDSSNPDVEVGPVSHSKYTKQQVMKPVSDRRHANRAAKGPALGSKERVQAQKVVVVQEEDTTDDDLPVVHIPSKATADIKEEYLQVGNANKRKRSEPSLEDQNATGHQYVAVSRKKVRTCTPRRNGYVADAGSCPQAPADTEETEADIREHAKNLLLFARGVQHSSPTPSPPNANSADAKANTRSDLTDSNTARSPSPFADLPVWPPAPTRTTTAAATSTFPPSHDYHERAAARSTQNQACKAPAPRQGMWNRTWFPTDTDHRAKANAAYHAGVKSALSTTNDAEPAPTIAPATPADKTLNQEPDLNNTEALQQKQSRANDAYQRTARGQTTNKEVVVIEVVETVTKSAGTPLRDGVAHVTPGSRTLEVVSA